MSRFVIGTLATAAGILLALFILAVWILHGVGSVIEGSKDREAHIPTVTWSKGQTFEVGGLSVSDLQIRGAYDLGGDEFFQTNAKGIFVVATMHVTNNGTERHDMTSLMQKLHIGAKEYHAESFALANTNMKESVDVDPGFSDDVSFAFDVPEASATRDNTMSFPEGAVLNLSGGIGGPDPNDVNVVLARAAVT